MTPSQQAVEESRGRIVRILAKHLPTMIYALVGTALLAHEELVRRDEIQRVRDSDSAGKE